MNAFFVVFGIPVLVLLAAILRNLQISWRIEAIRNSSKAHTQPNRLREIGKALW
jgi:hypothetical protein